MVQAGQRCATMERMKLVECVPNFSEGRRPEVVDAIAAAIAAAEGVRLLDRSSDPDHNRSVITFAGPPEAVVEGAFRGIERAAALIDLEQHQGVHPRMGAADVVPFVPLEGVTLADCAALAHQLGRRVGAELGLPVYLYEAAATRPERQRLELLRQGGYEALKNSIATDPARQPDYGPPQLGPAGAVIIGARGLLVAYNVFLNTDDVSVAQQIAAALRHSSGGLRYVKALGLLVGGRAQVSMNLTDVLQTPLPHIMEMIRSQAARYGTSVHHAELIGLIPQQALIAAAQWYLQLDAFQPDQVLETRLRQAFHPE